MRRALSPLKSLQAYSKMMIPPQCDVELKRCLLTDLSSTCVTYRRSYGLKSIRACPWLLQKYVAVAVGVEQRPNSCQTAVPVSFFGSVLIASRHTGAFVCTVMHTHLAEFHETTRQEQDSRLSDTTNSGSGSQLKPEVIRILNVRGRLPLTLRPGCTNVRLLNHQFKMSFSKYGLLSITC